LKKLFFLYQKNWGGHKKFWDIAPEHPPRTTDLPEINTIIKEALPRNVSLVTGLLGRNT